MRHPQPDSGTALYSERDCQYLQQLLAGLVATKNPNSLADQAPTAPELARETGLKLDVVKKKLKQLLANSLVEAISYTPKRYRLNSYYIAHHPEEPACLPFTDEGSLYYVVGLLGQDWEGFLRL